MMNTLSQNIIREHLFYNDSDVSIIQDPHCDKMNCTFVNKRSKDKKHHLISLDQIAPSIMSST